MLDDSASNSEEGSGSKEGNVFQGQQQLLLGGFSLHQILRLIRKVYFCIDLANDEEGAENRSKKELSATHPEVEKQEKLQG